MVYKIEKSFIRIKTWWGFRSISKGLTSWAALLSFSRGHDASSMVKAGVPAGDHRLTSNYLRPCTPSDHLPPASASSLVL